MFNTIPTLNLYSRSMILLQCTQWNFNFVSSRYSLLIGLAVNWLIHLLDSNGPIPICTHNNTHKKFSIILTTPVNGVIWQLVKVIGLFKAEDLTKKMVKMILRQQDCNKIGFIDGRNTKTLRSLTHVANRKKQTTNIHTIVDSFRVTISYHPVSSISCVQCGWYWT